MRSIIWISILAIALPLTAGVLVADDDPAPKAQDIVIGTLIKQLGADDFRTREAASKKLGELGEAARPALETAVKESKSPEVRWRAGQLLQQLAGVAAKPLDAEGRKDRPGAEPGAGPADESGNPEDPFEKMRKLLEQLAERGNSPFGGAFADAFGKQRIEAPGLVLERIRPGKVSLRVTRDAKEGERKEGQPEESEAKVEDVYVGSSLAEIVSRNPELARHPGMEELQRLEAQKSWPGLGEMLRRRLGAGIQVHPFPGGSGFGMATQSGVSITQDADGVTVKITEQDEDGNPQEKTYKGESLEAIKKEHPEIADKLGSFSVQWRVGPPDVFWPGQPDRRFKPLRPVPTTPSTPAQGPLFGVGLTDLTPALASQLKLESGQGAVVREVLPGSEAHDLGVLVHDVIVKVNDQAVDKVSAIQALRKAAAERAAGTPGPLTIELIRRGETRTISR